MDAVDLCDVTTQDGPIVTREPLNITSLLIGRLDGLEYSLGLRRGGSSEYANKPCTTVDLAKDMADKFSRGEWALMPSEDLMKKVCELFQVNHKLATKERIHFIQHLADAEYVYQLLPPVTDESMVLYVNNKAYPYPYTDFPPVRTTYHPCFTYPPFRTYMAEGYTDKEPNSFRDFNWLIRLVLEISRMVGQPINISWFHGTWGEFKSRPTAEVRYDPQPTPPPSDDLEEEPVTDDDLSYLEPLYRRERRRIVRYMKAHPHKYDSPEAAAMPSESAPKASVDGNATPLVNTSSSDTGSRLRRAQIPKAKKSGRATIKPNGESSQSAPQATRNKSSSTLTKKRKLADEGVSSPVSRTKQRKSA